MISYPDDVKDLLSQQFYTKKRPIDSRQPDAWH